MTETTKTLADELAAVIENAYNYWATHTDATPGIPPLPEFIAQAIAERLEQVGTRPRPITVEMASGKTAIDIHDEPVYRFKDKP